MSKHLLLPLLLLALLPMVVLSLDCGDGKIRGVNLGGLFVLEPWITPSIFQEVNVEHNDMVVDEYTYAQYVDPAYAKERLERHWDEFYTRSDLELLSNTGISHVRVPVGYWLVDVAPGEPFPAPPADDTEGQRFYLKRLLGWCESLGIKVLIDLHGAPGSQNGFDNSGRRGAVNWIGDDPNNKPNVDRTLVALDKIAQLMVDWINDGTITDTTLYGIAILNEPVGGWNENVWVEIRDHFHYNAYDVIRTHLPDAAKHKVYIQQAFRATSDFIGYMPESEGYFGVGLDLHNYHAFGDYWNGLAADSNGWSVNLQASCDYVSENGRQTLETVTGEWSLAVCDCQQYLDGGYANPYRPPNASPSTCEYYNGDFSTYPEDYKDFLRSYMLAQMDAYENADGWFFWTAKTEDNCGPEWDYVMLVEQGIAPANLCNRDRHCQ